MSNTATVEDMQRRGILFAVIAFMAISLNDACIKLLSDRYPLHEIVLWRAVIGMSITLLVVHLQTGFGSLRTAAAPWLILRGILIVLSNLCFFLALAAIDMAQATALFFVAPLLITALSAMLLREEVGFRRWVAVIVGLIGVFVMLRPGTGFFEWAALLPIIGAVTYSLMQIITRRVRAAAGAAVMAIYIQGTFIVASLFVGLAAGDGAYADIDHPSAVFLLRAWTIPTLEDAAILTGIGCLSAVIGYALSEAYRLGEASAIAPFEYILMPFAVLWSVLLWGEWPDPYTWAGTALIIGSGLFVIYREHVRGRPNASSRPFNRNR